MTSAALPALFGLLGCLSVLLALRRDEGRTGYWLAAVGLALALGFSLGGLFQDGRLVSRSEALERELGRLQEENRTLGAQLESFGLAPQPVTPGPPEATIPIPTPSARVATEGEGSSLPTEAVPNLAVDISADASGEAEMPSPFPTAQPDAETVTGPETPLEAEAATAPEITQPEVAPLETAPDEAPQAEAPLEAEAAETEASAPPELLSEPNLPAPEEAAPPEAAAETAESPEFVNLEGEWEMQTVTEETSYPPYLGLELTFQLEVEQVGAALNAQGEKLSERLPDDPALRSYPPGSRTPIELAGRLIGPSLIELTFLEEGSQRASGGEMVLTVVSPTRLEGSFSSSASGAAGSVRLQKLVTAASE